MADKSHIEWTDATWNVITGCSVLSSGCTNCYAMRLAGTRLRNHPSRAGLTKDSKAGPVWTGDVRFNEAWLMQPLTWRTPRRIFVCAHADLFHENVPDEWIDQVFAVMALTPHHTYQVLTKRAARMRAYIRDCGTQLGRQHELRHRIETLVPDSLERTNARLAVSGAGAEWRPLPNVVLGVSAERQPEANERILHLLGTPAAARFLSLEPLLGAIDLSDIPFPKSCECDSHQPKLDALNGTVYCAGCCEGPERLDIGTIHQVIVGGENGPRPMHPDWARELRDQCADAGVPFFFKQWGSWAPRAWCKDGGTHAMHREAPNYGVFQKIQSHPDSIERVGAHDGWQAFAKVGKAAAGRLLDGVEHNGMPEVTR